MKDCDEGGDCGGFTKSTALFDYKENCCNMLFWKDHSECVGVYETCLRCIGTVDWGYDDFCRPA